VLVVLVVLVELSASAPPFLFPCYKKKPMRFSASARVYVPITTGLISSQ
jgi:hypothetical protein